MAALRKLGVLSGSVALLGSGILLAADWPQWRGANRDGKALDFKAPESWPKELNQKWKTTVGTGDATPALVGDKVYVFAREGGDEVTLCLNAADGKEVWRDKYAAAQVTGAAASHGGPRACPAVAEGKVVTFGVSGVLSCLNAADGKVVWRKESARDFSPAYPQFYTASSPIITDGLCIAHLGGGGKGAVIAFDLNTGDRKWDWTGEGPAYSSPVLMTVEGVKQVVELGERSMVGLSLTDGKLLWEMSTGGGPGPRGPGGPGGAGPGPGGPPPGPGGPGGGPGRGGRGPGRGMGGMGRSYNAPTPVIEGNTIFVAGQGVRAVQISKQDDKFDVKELWNNPEINLAFNSPVLKDGRLYGLSGNNSLFCLDATSGKSLWTSEPLPTAGAAGGGQGGGRGGRMMGRGGFGSVVDAGSVLLALTPASELVVFKPDEKEFKEVTKLKVADSPTYAYPVVSDNRILVKDQDSVIMYALE